MTRYELNESLSGRVKPAGLLPFAPVFRHAGVSIDKAIICQWGAMSVSDRISLAGFGKGDT